MSCSISQATPGTRSACPLRPPAARAPVRRARGRARRAASCRFLLFRSLRARALRYALQVHEEERDCRRRDTGNACRLADSFRPLRSKLLPHFVGEPPHLRVIERLGKLGRFLRLASRDLLLLALDVPLILRLDLNLLADLGREVN